MTRRIITTRSAAIFLAATLSFLGLATVMAPAHAQVDRAGAATDLTGTWDSNIGMVYTISRTTAGFEWRVKGSPQVGKITIEGDRLNASWGPQDGPVAGRATGTITESAGGRPSRIQWSNRVVFTRRPDSSPQVQMVPQPATRIDPGGPVHVDPIQVERLEPTGAGPSDVLRQRAAQLVEELRQVIPGGEWTEAAVTGTVRDLYRPDLQQPAFAEFEVRGLSGSPAGFIILSTGQHDYPVANWSSEGKPPTHLLDEMAAKNGKKAFRYYKLTDLAYAAEDQYRCHVHTSTLNRCHVHTSTLVDLRLAS